MPKTTRRAGPGATLAWLLFFAIGASAAYWIMFRSDWMRMLVHRFELVR